MTSRYADFYHMIHQKIYSFYILEYCKQVLISKTFSYIFAPSFFRNTYLELYLDPEKVIKKE